MGRVAGSPPYKPLDLPEPMTISAAPFGLVEILPALRSQRFYDIPSSERVVDDFPRYKGAGRLMSVLVTRERFSYESLAGHLKVRRVYRHETNRDLDGEGVEKWIMQALGLHQLHRQANGEVRPHISEDNRVTAGYLAALEMVIDLRLY